MIVNKLELCRIIDTSVPTLNQLILKYGPQFPCVERGGPGREYQFEADDVVEFLRQKEEEAARAGAERDELMRQYTLPGVEVDAPGFSPADQLRLAQLRKLEREEQIRCGMLIEASELRAVLTDAFGRLGRDMSSAIEQVLRESNIPPTVIRSIRAQFDEARRGFVKKVGADLCEGGIPEAALENLL